MLFEEIFKVVCYYVKSVRIRSFSSPHFPTFGMNTEIYAVRMRENTDQKTPNKDTFYAVFKNNTFHAKCFNFILPGNLKKQEVIILGDIERKHLGELGLI